MPIRFGAVLTAALALLAPVAAHSDAAMDARIEALIPDLEAQIATGMADFHVPALAIGIVSGDRLVYARGFGIAAGGTPVDADTIFQIGSTTKAFLATSQAIAVDRGQLAWNERVVDRLPDFQLQDPWVTREFRVTDIMAQRSGLPPEANDILAFLGFDEAAMVRSLRSVTPTLSFRSDFTYTNITHLLGQRLLAEATGAADWQTFVRSEILEPLGMTRTSFTADAIADDPNATVGHVWTPERAIEVPFTAAFPYALGAAGAINSTVSDMARWLRLHLARGSFDGTRIVSPENLAVTKTPRVAINDRLAYAMGWATYQTENGQIIWHNGGTTSYGAYVGTLIDQGVGIVILTNLANVGLPDALGHWTLERLLDDPEIDHVGRSLEAAIAADRQTAATFTPPATPDPAPPLPNLAGRFSDPNLGEVVVSVGGDQLVAQIAATGARLSLAPWNGLVFVMKLIPEDGFAARAANLGPAPLGFATFVPAPDGTAARLALWFAPQPDQTYDLVRVRP